jgi:hypothetical protein
MFVGILFAGQTLLMLLFLKICVVLGIVLPSPDYSINGFIFNSFFRILFMMLTVVSYFYLSESSLWRFSQNFHRQVELEFEQEFSTKYSYFIRTHKSLIVIVATLVFFFSCNIGRLFVIEEDTLILVTGFINSICFFIYSALVFQEVVYWKFRNREVYKLRLNEQLSLHGYSRYSRLSFSTFTRLSTNIGILSFALGSGIGASSAGLQGSEALYKYVNGSDAVSPLRSFIINTFVFKNDPTGVWTETKLRIAYQNKLAGFSHPPKKAFISMSHEERELMIAAKVSIDLVDDYPADSD